MDKQSHWDIDEPNPSDWSSSSIYPISHIIARINTIRLFANLTPVLTGESINPRTTDFPAAFNLSACVGWSNTL